MYIKWKANEITGTKAIEITGLKRNKFYDFVRLYENGGIIKWKN